MTQHGKKRSQDLNPDFSDSKVYVPCSCTTEKGSSHRIYSLEKERKLSLVLAPSSPHCTTVCVSWGLSATRLLDSGLPEGRLRSGTSLRTTVSFGLTDINCPCTPPLRDKRTEPPQTHRFR